MTLKIELQMKRFGYDKDRPRVHARIMRDIHRRCLERQWKRRVPQHFEQKAYALYGARRRSEKYNATKLKTVHHTRPNVKTGTLLKRLRHKITATQKGGRLLMRSSLGKQIDPKVWEKMTPEQRAKESRKRRRLADWQKREIAVMTKGEIREERGLQAKEYLDEARKAGNKRRRVRRIK